MPLKDACKMIQVMFDSLYDSIKRPDEYQTGYLKGWHEMLQILKLLSDATEDDLKEIEALGIEGFKELVSKSI